MPVFFEFSIYFPRQVEMSSAASQHAPCLLSVPDNSTCLCIWETTATWKAWSEGRGTFLCYVTTSQTHGNVGFLLYFSNSLAEE